MSKIIIEKYNPEWPLLFEKEALLLEDIFDGEYKSLNHIGSTSVPGLSAQPVIDISIGVIEFKEKSYYEDKLSETLYCYSNGLSNWYLFKRYERQKFHLHIMPYDSRRLVEQIIFCYCLKRNPELAKECQ